MAVETRYVVIRTDKNNVEQDVMTFTDKRAADEHDKMLDMADALFDVMHASSVEFSESQCEELSIYLAKQRDDVLIALQAKKKTAPTDTTSKKSKMKKKTNESQNELLQNVDENDISPKSLSETLLADNESNLKTQQKSKQMSADKDETLVDFVIEKDDAA